MIERNELDMAVRDLALRHAPPQIAQVGDIVMAQCGWERPHEVRITRVAVEIVIINLTFARRKELGLTGWLMVEYQYIGRRVQANGVGFTLYKFTTADGKKYERICQGFNHIGLVFDIP